MAGVPKGSGRPGNIGAHSQGHRKAEEVSNPFRKQIHADSCRECFGGGRRRGRRRSRLRPRSGRLSLQPGLNGIVRCDGEDFSQEWTGKRQLWPAGQGGLGSNHRGEGSSRHVSFGTVRGVCLVVCVLAQIRLPKIKLTFINVYGGTKQ